MPRTRIRGNQEQDIDFLSESELNEFFGKVVITGTLAGDQDNEDATQDTVVLESFNSFFPGQGIIQGFDGAVVITGTESVIVSGTQLGVGTINTASGTIDIVGAGETTVFTVGNTITISGSPHPGASTAVTSLNSLTGDLTIDAGANVTIDTSDPSITISAENTVSDAILGAGEVVVISGANTTTISGTPHTINTDTVSDAIIGGENITVVSGANTTTISSPDVIADALVGAGEVVVTSGSNVITISGTPHTENTDTVSDAIIGGENVTVTSGIDTTTISSLNTVSDAIVGLGEVVVISGADTTIISGTPHTVNTDTVSDAITGGVGITVTSGTSETTIDGHLRYTKDENDAIIGGENVTVTSGTDTITISSVDTVSDAIIGGENVTVISGADTTTISSVDTVSDAIIGGVGITVTSGTDTTTVDGHLRYTKDENDAIIGGENVTVVSGADTITISSVDTVSDAIIGGENVTVISGTDTTTISSVDTVSDALVAGNGVIITSGTDTTTIASFDEPDIDSVTTSGITVTGSLNLETIGGLSLLPDNSDSDNPTITISGGREVGQLIGNFFQIEFTNGGNTSNTWLAVSDSNLSSTTTPWVVAYQCRLAGMAFSNRNDDVDQDVEIYVAREGDGNADVLEYTWELRGVRTAAKTDIDTSELQLFQGDKVAVYLNDQGGNARDVFVGIYVEIVARTDSEITENWSGNF